MSKEKPNFVDRAFIMTWSSAKKAEYLYKSAIDGRKDWVLYLLRDTGYEAYPSMLQRKWWVNEVDQAHLAARLKTAQFVLLYLVKKIDRAKLPAHVALNVPKTDVAARQLILSLTRINYELK